MPKKFHDRHFPVRPNLEQLEHQAKDLLRAVRQANQRRWRSCANIIPNRPSSRGIKLADAQLRLAHSYGLASWPRLVSACRLTDAIWRGDVDAVRSTGDETSQAVARERARLGRQQLGSSHVVRGERRAGCDHPDAAGDGRD